MQGAETGENATDQNHDAQYYEDRKKAPFTFGGDYRKKNQHRDQRYKKHLRLLVFERILATLHRRRRLSPVQRQL